MAPLQFHCAPPTASHRSGRNLELTINTDHSVGADHPLPPEPGQAENSRPERLKLGWLCTPTDRKPLRLLMPSGYRTPEAKKPRSLENEAFDCDDG